MQFLHPWMLLGLILVPVAVLLHVFRAPGRKHEVPSLALWREVLRRTTPESTETLRRLDWLLLLEILVIALLVLGLAWPVIWAERPHREIGIILDTSASMKTVEADRRTRLDRAGEIVRQIRSRLAEGDVARDYSAPAKKPCDVALDTERLLSGGLAALGRGPQVVFLVTDKPPAKADDPRVRIVAVGGPSRNAGIVAFSGDMLDDGRCSVFLRLANFASSRQERKLTLMNAGKEVAYDDLSLAPDGGTEEKVFKVRLAASDPVLRVKLEPEGRDGLASDDEVAGVFKPLTVVATGKSVSPAYARLFGGPVFEGTTYLEAPENAGVPPDAMVIADGVIPQSLGALTAVVNPPAGEVAGITIGAEKASDAASPLAVAGDDAMTKGFNPADLRPAKYHPLTLGETARPLMRIGADTVAASADLAGTKVIVIGFDPAAAGWTLKPSFVVFWANILAEAGKAAGAGGLVVGRTGDVVRVPLGDAAGEIEGPGGKSEVLPGKDGWASFTPTLVGVYRWTAGNRSGCFAANLLSETESDNRPSPLAGRSPSFDLPAPLAGQSVPLGPWLCLAAAVLAGAWWHFRR